MKVQASFNLGGRPLAGYRVILADPPWLYDDKGARGGTAKHYEGLPLERILALPVGAQAAADSHLYLWVTNTFMRAGLDVMEAWGFRYVLPITWVKDRLGNGHYFRGTTEHLLFGVRGNWPLLRHDKGTHFRSPRRAHSQKPELSYKLIEECSPGHDRLELFARKRRRGWAGWGDQLKGGLSLPDLEEACRGPREGAAHRVESELLVGVDGG